MTTINIYVYDLYMYKKKGNNMKQSKVKFVWNNNYNMNCDIDELNRLGFINSTYNNDLAPSYMNKKENIQVFFLDLEDPSVKNEKIDYKFSIMKLDEHGEYSKTIGTTNSFNEMVELVKKHQ